MPGHTGILDLSQFVEDPRVARRQALLTDVQRGISELGPPGTVSPGETLGSALGTALGAGLTEGLDQTGEVARADLRNRIVSGLDVNSQDSLRTGILAAKEQGDTKLALGLTGALDSLINKERAEAKATRKEGREERTISLAEQKAKDTKRDKVANLQLKRLTQAQDNTLGWAKFVQEGQKIRATTGVKGAKDIANLNSKNSAPVKAQMLSRGFTIDEPWTEADLVAAQKAVEGEGRDGKIIDLVSRIDVDDIANAVDFLEQTKEEVSTWEKLTGVEIEDLEAADLAGRAAALLVDNPEMKLTDRMRIAIGIEVAGARDVETLLTEAEAAAIIGRGRENATPGELRRLQAFRAAR